MADNLDDVIVCLQNTQWLNYEIPACSSKATFTTWSMLFSLLLKMFKKKMAHLFVNINFGFKFRYWLTHAIFDRFKLNMTQMKKQDFIFKYTKKRFIMSNGKVLS